MWTMAEDIWRVVVSHQIGTPELLIPWVSLSVPDAELTIQLHQVYNTYVVLLRRLHGATRGLRPCIGGGGEQEAQGTTIES